MIRMDGLRFLGIGINTQNSTWHLGPTSHAFWEIVIVTKGGQKTEVNGNSEEYRTGHAMLFPPFRLHEEWGLPGHSLESHFLSFIWDDPNLDLPSSVFDRDGRLRMLSSWLLRERLDTNAFSTTLSQSLCMSLLLEYARLGIYADDQIVSRTRLYVEANLLRHYTDHDLASNVGMSKFHFIRSFKSKTGQTPMQDIRRIRVERARDLLLTSNRPLKEIADLVGFADEQHLCHVFKSYFGTSPGRIRK